MCCTYATTKIVTATSNKLVSHRKKLGGISLGYVSGVASQAKIKPKIKAQTLNQGFPNFL